jgi:alkanesulfonate monooxygenase SsuD/methylene tetrahydromethanopterin reductase-like flavin-dependent oxidoreductase (luciferase family)
LEFGIFVQMFLPGPKAHDPAAEHAAALNELELIREADRNNWKYVWCTEHHTLTEYSHLSASESFIPYALAQTERIHVGSGIFPLNPVTNHPVRIAEARGDARSPLRGSLRVRLGSGRGSHELGTFNVDPAETKANWDEVIWEFTKMWDSFEYSHDGAAFLDAAAQHRPQAVRRRPDAPADVVAAGNPPTYEKAARHGRRARFNVAAIHDMKDHVEALRRRSARPRRQAGMSTTT